MRKISLALVGVLLLTLGFWAMKSKTASTGNVASNLAAKSITPKTESKGSAHARTAAEKTLPAAPTKEDLAGTGLELSLNSNGNYQIAPAGDVRVDHEVLTAGTPEVWRGQEENLLVEINGEKPEISETEEAFIASWRESLSRR